jgi:hypothetical protein
MLGDIGIFLRTKKVSFLSCWVIGHFLKAKKASLRKFLLNLFHPVGEFGTFLMARKFSFHPVEEIGTFSYGKESFFFNLLEKLAFLS